MVGGPNRLPESYTGHPRGDSHHTVLVCGWVLRSYTATAYRVMPNVHGSIWGLEQIPHVFNKSDVDFALVASFVVVVVAPVFVSVQVMHREAN